MEQCWHCGKPPKSPEDDTRKEAYAIVGTSSGHIYDVFLTKREAECARENGEVPRQCLTVEKVAVVNQ